MSFRNGSKTVGGRGYRQHTSLKDLVRWRDSFTCQICGGYGDEVDHIVPWGISHDSTLPNLRVLCLKCNRATSRSKHNALLPLADYYQALEAELAA